MMSRSLLCAIALPLGALPLSAQLSEVPSWDVVEVPEGRAAGLREGSFIRQVQVALPNASTTAEELSAINPHLPTLLPGFSRLMGSAEVSSRYRELYHRKLALLQDGKPLTTHNFFDCETVLRLRDPGTGRRVLLLQADMDVVTDGSDPVRAGALADYNLARSSDWFLPETSYSWNHPGPARNPFLDYYPETLGKLETLRAQLAAEAEQDQGVVWREMLKSCDDQIYRVKMRGLGTHTQQGLKQRRFLLADRDPFVVLPIPWVNKNAEWSPQIGDYAVVIHGERLYPAVLGDAGPAHKVGEASLRLARALNPLADGKTRAVSELTVTYLFFPRTAGPRREPDLNAWRQRAQELLTEIGGLSKPAALHDWNAEAGAN